MQCTALSKRKLRQGLPKEECRCSRRAVKGYTVCQWIQMHGAGSVLKGRKGGRPLIHGQRSKRPSNTITDLIQRYEGDTDLTNLDKDIALLRGLLEQKISHIDLEDKKDFNNNINGVRDLMRDIRYTIQQKSDIQSQYMIPIENVQMFLQSIVLVLTTNIKDKELLQSILNQIQNIRILESDIYDQRKYLPNKFNRRWF